MKSFITGINGFAGSYLAEILLKQGHTVYGLIQPGTSYSNIEKIKNKLQLWESDLLDQRCLAEIFKGVCPDNVFHLAGISSVKQSFDQPVNSFFINTLGGIHILEIMRNTISSAKLIIVSSGQVYGDGKDEMFNEETSINPKSPYAASKASLELIAKVYVSSFGLKVIIARPFSHIGPRQSEIFFVPTIVKQIVKIENGLVAPIILTGDLNLSRDYTDVRDMAAAYNLLIEKGRPGEIYNICSGNKYLLRYLVEIMIGFSKNNKIVINTDPLKLRRADIHEGNYNNEKIKAETGWEPKIDIRITLRDTLDYWRGVLAKG